jgi:glycosyltransferase involved in cell wall biosynthesis
MVEKLAMKKTICLNMIVKNESHIIKRCFDSIKNLIDTWVIVDTGSTDGTQDLIKQLLKDKPGELHERPWVNFGHNRQEALELARGKSDYVLFIDADDELLFEENFNMPELNLDAYYIKQKESLDNVFREHDVYLLVKNDGDFEWKGALHEHLEMKREKSIGFITSIKNQYNADGDRSRDVNKIKKDIDLLKGAIARNEEPSRALFYLGRTYWSIKAYASTIECFEKRAAIGGDPMEVYHSLLYIGIAQRKLNYPHEVFINSFCRAHLYRPSRAESIYELTRYFSDTENYFLGYTTAKIAIGIPLPSDNLFVESWVYDWGSLLYFFVCANQIEKKLEAFDALRILLSKKTLPNGIRHSFQLENHFTNLEQTCG